MKLLNQTLTSIRMLLNFHGTIIANQIYGESFRPIVTARKNRQAQKDIFQQITFPNNKLQKTTAIHIHH